MRIPDDFNARVRICIAVFFAALTVVFGILWLAGGMRTVTHTVPELGVSFETSGNWKENPTPENVDFYYRNGNGFFGGRVFYSSELAKGYSAADVLIQSENSFKNGYGVGSEGVIYENKEIIADGKKITYGYYKGTVPASGEGMGFYGALIEFDGTDKCVLCVFTAPVNLADKKLSEWKEITASIKNLD